MRMKLAHRLTLGFATALLLLALNAWMTFNAFRYVIETQKWVTHTYQVLREIETDVSLAKDVETGARGYVITANRAFLAPYEMARVKVKAHLEPLYTLTRDNPAQQKRVLELAARIDRKLQTAKKQIALVNAGRRLEAELLVSSGEGKAVMDAVRAKADEMRNEEERLLKIRTETSRIAARRAHFSLFVAVLFSLLLLSLVYSVLARSKVQSENLATALAELKRLEAMRDSLNEMLVHDLRTPLTTMLGPLEMLQTEQFGQLEETQREIVGISLLSSRRLLGLVNELLDIAKMEAGEMRVRRESLRPQIVIDEAIKHIALSEYDGGHRIEREVPDVLPSLQADQELLTRVLINLLGNAVKFTPRGGKITLGVRECVPLEVLPPRLKPVPGRKIDEILQTPSLLFCVRDTGEGVPAAYLDRIFDKFGQVENRKEGRKRSTGLGLTFCKLTVEAHGGQIWAESEINQGSTFYFTIPLRFASNDANAPDAETTKQATAANAL